MIGWSSLPRSVLSKHCQIYPTHLRVQYTSNWKLRAPDIQQKTSYVGNNMKSLHISVEASLKKLRTDYIDILYVHWVRSYLIRFE